LRSPLPPLIGQVPIERVFGRDVHSVVAKLNIEGQHRGAVAAAKSRMVSRRGWWCAVG
jgi:hypothetical protein